MATDPPITNALSVVYVLVPPAWAKEADTDALKAKIAEAANDIRQMRATPLWDAFTPSQREAMTSMANLADGADPRGGTLRDQAMHRASTIGHELAYAVLSESYIDELIVTLP